MMNVLSRPDARDFMSLPPQNVDYLAGLEGLTLGKLKIGLLADMRCGLPVHPEVRAAATAAAKALEAAGCAVEEMPSFLTPGDARRHVPLLRGALVPRVRAARRRQAGQGAAVHRRVVQLARAATSAAAT